ncbi:CLUMA_CG020575, isoform A [Clunio marinus]|uniref:CLUMA_CG020575, isoform A n=1 Tax=Clunio marinus TaxID=568069 RepID=A0A1J1J6K6_9DIPT|nr:CLUMA_CG020575, isoform A [Clunio marinus]
MKIMEKYVVYVLAFCFLKLFPPPLQFLVKLQRTKVSLDVQFTMLEHFSFDIQVKLRFLLCERRKKTESIAENLEAFKHYKSHLTMKSRPKKIRACGFRCLTEAHDPLIFFKTTCVYISPTVYSLPES